MSYEGFSLSEVGNSGCELTRRAIWTSCCNGAHRGLGPRGLVRVTDLAITYAGSGLKVEVRAGRAHHPGAERYESGYDFPTPPPQRSRPPRQTLSNPRIETILAQGPRQSYEGAANEFKLELIEGTANSATTLTNLKAPRAIGGPSLPMSVLVLGDILIPAGATTISNVRHQERRDGSGVGLAEHQRVDSAHEHGEDRRYRIGSDGAVGRGSPTARDREGQNGADGVRLRNAGDAACLLQIAQLRRMGARSCRGRYHRSCSGGDIGRRHGTPRRHHDR